MRSLSSPTAALAAALKAEHAREAVGLHFDHFRHRQAERRIRSCRLLLAQANQRYVPGRVESFGERGSRMGRGIELLLHGAHMGRAHRIDIGISHVPGRRNDLGRHRETLRFIDPGGRTRAARLRQQIDHTRRKTDLKAAQHPGGLRLLADDQEWIGDLPRTAALRRRHTQPCIQALIARGIQQGDLERRVESEFALQQFAGLPAGCLPVRLTRESGEIAAGANADRALEVFHSRRPVRGAGGEQEDRGKRGGKSSDHGIVLALESRHTSPTGKLKPYPRALDAEPMRCEIDRRRAVGAAYGRS